MEVRKFKFTSLFGQSAALLDLSLGGFKLAFTEKYFVKTGKKYWLVIPLRSLGLKMPTDLICQVQVKWFDPNLDRMGGVFIELSQTEHQTISHLIAHLNGQ